MMPEDEDSLFSFYRDFTELEKPLLEEVALNPASIFFEALLLFTIPKSGI